jgi:hypothetical protein
VRDQATLIQDDCGGTGLELQNRYFWLAQKGFVKMGAYWAGWVSERPFKFSSMGICPLQRTNDAETRRMWKDHRPEVKFWRKIVQIVSDPREVC